MTIRMDFPGLSGPRRVSQGGCRVSQRVSRVSQPFGFPSGFPFGLIRAIRIPIRILVRIQVGHSDFRVDCPSVAVIGPARLLLCQLQPAVVCCVLVGRPNTQPFLGLSPVQAWNAHLGNHPAAQVGQAPAAS